MSCSNLSLTVPLLVSRNDTDFSAPPVFGRPSLLLPSFGFSTSLRLLVGLSATPADGLQPPGTRTICVFRRSVFRRQR